MLLRSKHFVALAAIAAAMPGAVMANMPMFFVIGFTRFVYWWTVPFAIAVELVAIRYIFRVTWGKAATLSLAANVVSAVAGILVYPLIGTALYPALAPAVVGIFGFGFTVEAAATTLAMAGVDTALELGIIALFLRTATFREGLLFLASNIVTAALLLATLLYANAPPRLSEAERSAFLSDYAAQLVFLSEVLQEAPDNLGATDFTFDEDWLAEKAAQAEDLRFDVLRVGTKMRMGHIASSYGRGMYGATLQGQTVSDEFTIRLWARDPRDGGGKYWTVFGALDRGEQRYSVNAELK